MHLKCIKSTMGQNASQLEKQIGAEQVPINEHFYGLVNFGNTCYCNSVIQALYFCPPFREKVLAYKQQLKKSGSNKENLLTCLADLFHNIATQKRRVGTVAPKKFVVRLKKENELFDNFMQQDAHEFLNYLLNTIADILVDEKRQEKQVLQQDHHAHNNQKGHHSKGAAAYGNQLAPMPLTPLDAASLNSAVVSKLLESQKCTGGLNSENSYERSNLGVAAWPSQPPASLTQFNPEPTWVHQIFQGTLTNETRCLNCESVSSKDEDFLDLSVDVEPNTSITHCLRVFSDTETLCAEQKYYCDTCCSKQEARKMMKVKRLPLILALHLKRFKFSEQFNRFTKLSYRVLFPLELRLFNTSSDASNADRLYNLVAVVVHCGSTPNRGHYITVVKSHGFWLLFDDDIVDKIEAQNIEDFFGLTLESAGGGVIPGAGSSATGNFPRNSESAYILFYQAATGSAS